MSNKKIISSLIILTLYLCTTIIPISYVIADNDDDLGFKEGETYTWIVEVMDHKKYYDAYGYTFYRSEGIKITSTIEYIYKRDNDWQIELETSFYKTNADVQTEEDIITIEKDGANLVIDPYTHFIPKDAKDYLKDWSPPADYSVDGLKVTYDDTVNNVEEIWEFQENGILHSYSIKFKDDIIYKEALEEGISFGFYFLGFIAIAIIGIVIIKKYRGVN